MGCPLPGANPSRGVCWWLEAEESSLWEGRGKFPSLLESGFTELTSPLFSWCFCFVFFFLCAHWLLNFTSCCLPSSLEALKHVGLRKVSDGEPGNNGRNDRGKVPCFPWCLEARPLCRQAVYPPRHPACSPLLPPPLPHMWNATV